MTVDRRPVRSFAAFLAAAVLALTGAGVIVLSSAESAGAAPLFLDTPENTIFRTSPATLTGTANPGDTITVNPGPLGPNDCVTIADGTGAWSCDLVLTRSGQAVFTASRPANADPDQDSEGWEYYVNLAPEVDGPLPAETVLIDMPVVSGSNAAPAAAIHVEATPGVNVCDTVADPGGTWTCVLPPLADGPWTLAVTQDPAFDAVSNVRSFGFQVDSTNPTGRPIFITPADSTLPVFPPVGLTSDLTPTITGTGEPLGTAHLQWGPVGAFPPVTPLCTAPVDAAGNWSCVSSTTFAVGQTVWIGGYSSDQWGRTGPSPDPDIEVTFVAGPAAPSITTPAPGTSTLDRTPFISGPPAVGPVSVEINGTPACTVTQSAAGWSCTLGPLGPGTYTAIAYVTDTYGTRSPTSSRTFTVLAPAVTPPLTFTVRVTDERGKDITGQPVAPGDIVILTAIRLPPGAVAVAELHSDPVALGTRTIGADGLFRLTTVIPRTVVAGDHTFVVSVTPPGATATVVETGVPIREAAPDPAAPEGPVDDAAGAAPDPTTGGAGFTSPSSFSNTLQTASEVRITPVSLAVTGAVASAFLLLVAFPAELLEATIRSNYQRLFRWLDPVAARVGRARAAVATALRLNRWVGSILMVALTAVVLGFADPGFGLNGSSLRLWIALVVSIVLINVVVSSIVMSVAKRRFSIDSTLEPMPAAVLLVAASVVVSRLAGIQPGLLFSVVLGIAFAVELRKRQDGLLVLLGVGLSIVIGIGSWLGYSALVGSGERDAGFWQLLAQETLAATTVEALATMVIALLPLKFLDGKSLFDWNRWVWVGTYLVAIAAFVLIILPIADNWGSATAPLVGWGILAAGFAVFAVTLWALLRYLPVRRGSPE